MTVGSVGPTRSVTHTMKARQLGQASMVSKSSLLGAAGEHFVMCQLLRRGFIAALAPAGVPNADIIVSDDLGHRLSAIQVKSRVAKGSDGGWHMKAKHEEIASPSLFYVFVDFGAPERHEAPSCWVVPSTVVADVIRRSHAAWLAAPGKSGQAHKDGVLRRFLPDYDRKGLSIGYGPGWLDPFREAWDQIG